MGQKMSSMVRRWRNWQKFSPDKNFQLHGSLTVINRSSTEHIHAVHCTLALECKQQINYVAHTS